MEPCLALALNPSATSSSSVLGDGFAATSPEHVSNPSGLWLHARSHSVRVKGQFNPGSVFELKLE